MPRNPKPMDEEALIRELEFKAVRSSGPGGQHVNKVSSKVVLSFDLANSQALSDKDKAWLLDKLQNQLISGEKLQLYADSARSQHKNRELVTQKFLDLIKVSLKRPKRRVKTSPSKSAVRKRLEDKKKRSTKKETRKKPPLNP